MRRKLVICFYLICLSVGIIGFISVGKFVWFDCAVILQNGFTEEIGFGMALIIFYVLGFIIPGFIVEFIKFCISSGKPDDK